jgi:hypothetical protein
MQEAHFSTLKDPRLMPVLFSIPGGFLLVMPRGQLPTHDEFANVDRDWLRTALDELPLEGKRRNFAWYNGQIVAIDYGS